MDLSEMFGGAMEVAKHEVEKHRAANTKECGCVPVGAFVARLIKKWPSPVLVESGELDPADMDGEGAMPELTLYRPYKRAVQIIGRADLDALADLLTSNGYGRQGRGGRKARGA